MQKEKPVKGMVVFDCDGTLTDSSHRVHYLQETPKNWDAFFAAQINDPPRMDVIRLVRMYAASTPFKIVVLTGRPEKYRRMTLEWLRIHAVPHDMLVMRADDDRTDDHILKQQHLRDWMDLGYQILGFFDDRRRICDVARQMGITVFQMSEGDF